MINDLEKFANSNNVAIVKPVQREDMSLEEAEATIDQLKGSFDNCRRMLFELRAKNGWMVLGYRSMTECLRDRLGMNIHKVFRELQAAEVEIDIDPNRQMGWLPQAHARELKALPKELRKEVYETVALKGEITVDAIVSEIDNIIERDSEVTREVFRNMTRAQQEAWEKRNAEKYKHRNQFLDEIENDAKEAVEEANHVEPDHAHLVHHGKKYFRRMVGSLQENLVKFEFRETGEQAHDILNLFLKTVLAESDL